MKKIWALIAVFCTVSVASAKVTWTIEKTGTISDTSVFNGYGIYTVTFHSESTDDYIWACDVKVEGQVAQRWRYSIRDELYHSSPFLPSEDSNPAESHFMLLSSDVLSQTSKETMDTVLDSTSNTSYEYGLGTLQGTFGINKSSVVADLTLLQVVIPNNGKATLVGQLSNGNGAKTIIGTDDDPIIISNSTSTSDNSGSTTDPTSGGTDTSGGSDTSSGTDNSGGTTSGTDTSSGTDNNGDTQDLTTSGCTGLGLTFLLTIIAGFGFISTIRK